MVCQRCGAAADSTGGLLPVGGQLFCESCSTLDPESVFSTLLLQGRAEEALHFAGDLVARVPDPWKRATVLLRLGVLCERANMFDAASRVYRTGLAFEPMDRDTSYFLQNNLGYSLNQLRRFPQGAACCRAAIRTDSRRHNAWKNLGVALEGQSRFGEAAAAFLNAIRLWPQDPRAPVHLAEMAEREHDAVAAAIPDFEDTFERAAEVVNDAIAGRVEEPAIDA